MTGFLLGFIIGAIVGAGAGFIGLALCVAARQGDAHLEALDRDAGANPLEALPRVQIQATDGLGHPWPPPGTTVRTDGMCEETQTHVGGPDVRLPE
ncbi:MAG: hypothetical protein AAB857_01615 [Patescibacteria group bacterium]